MKKGSPMEDEKRKVVKKRKYIRMKGSLESTHTGKWGDGTWGYG